jgi:hypothetical protein
VACREFGLKGQQPVHFGESDAKINLGCLHPVVRVISYDVGFNPSTQRHYRRYI